MFVEKLKFNIKYRYSNLKDVFVKHGVSWGVLGVCGLMILVIAVFSINIYNVYDRGRKNFEQLVYEKEKLIEVEAEGKELEEELQYRKSLQFVKTYANENLYMGRIGERLFKVDREEDVVYELEERNIDPIVLEDHKGWWSKIFL